MKWISYYIRDIKPNGHRNHWAILLLFDSANWAERNRQHRGAQHHHLAFKRNMQPCELAEYQEQFRLVSRMYYDWNGLIEDEKLILGDDHPFIQVLEQERLKYRNIPGHPPGQLKLNLKNG